MSKESLKRLEEVTRRTFGEPVAHLEDLTRLEAEVERLTAELAESKELVEWHREVLTIVEEQRDDAESREKALRAITEEMDRQMWDEATLWEWDRRAWKVT